MHGNIGSVKRVRIVRRDDTWTLKEGEVLRANWPDVHRIKDLLPHRSEQAIRNMAKRCNLIPDRDQHIWTCAQDRTLRRMAAAGAKRREIANVLGLTLLQVKNRMHYRRINIAKRPPKPVNDPLVSAIRQRAFELNITPTELDRSLGRGHIFRNVWGGRCVSMGHIVRAAKALGGSLTIEWCDQ